MPLVPLLHYLSTLSHAGRLQQSDFFHICEERIQLRRTFSCQGDDNSCDTFSHVTEHAYGLGKRIEPLPYVLLILHFYLPGDQAEESGKAALWRGACTLWEEVRTSHILQATSKVMCVFVFEDGSATQERNLRTAPSGFDWMCSAFPLSSAGRHGDTQLESYVCRLYQLTWQTNNLLSYTRSTLSPVSS